MRRSLLLLGLACLALTLTNVHGATSPSCLSGAARRDCGYPDESSCVSGGCCWSPVQSTADESLTANWTAAEWAAPPAQLASAGTPWCFAPQSLVGGYRVTSVSSNAAPQNPGWLIQLALYDGAGYFGADVAALSVAVTFETASRLRVKVFDPQSARWEIPASVLPFAPLNTSLRAGDAHYTFSYTSQPFGFAVTRLEDGEVLFNSTAPLGGPDGATPLFNGLVFQDQYLELSSQLPAQPALYGLGEKVTSLQLATQGDAITFWARDAPSPPDQNVYGSHPFYLEQRRINGVSRTHGVWLRNSNGMDVLIYDSDAARKAAQVQGSEVEGAEGEAEASGSGTDSTNGYITYRVIGGVLDFFIYVGGSTADGSTSTPAGITQQYHASVGLPHMPPLWSLGFHNCRWGYPNLAAVKTVVAKYAEAGIPLDTAWTDIDYMDNLEDFSTDPINFPSSAVSAFISQLHAQGQHYVVIIDPAIHNRTGYPTFEDGLAKDVFIKQASGELFVGKVWPGYTAFPSFYADNTQAWWSANIEAFRAAVPVDGLWIDMNEASNFCTGDCDTPTNRVEAAAARAQASGASVRRHLGEEEEEQQQEQEDVAPRQHGSRHAVVTESVRPGAAAPNPRDLCEAGLRKTTCQPNAPPYRINNAGKGIPLNVNTLDMDATHGSQQWLEYDVHNMYGLSEAIATNIALESNTNQRSLVISRSTFSGSGSHTGHWLGDNWSTWASMRYSIPGVLAMGFFGVPLVGADICGFNGNTNEELCARWMALGAFYPFSRNHNAKGSVPQEPYMWSSVASISRTALLARYSLLHVYNTLFFQAHMQGGGAVARPLFFTFAQDPLTWSLDAQFMIGSAVLVTPVLTQGATDVTGYWPPLSDEGEAQLWYDFYTLQLFSPGPSGTATVPAPWSTIPLHIAGGNILPMQTPALTVSAQLHQPMSLLVAPCSRGHASGSLFMDDGSTLSVGSASTSLQASFWWSNHTLTYQASGSFRPQAPLQSIQVLGLGSAPTGASYNGAGVQVAFDAATAVATIQLPNVPLTQAFQAMLHF